MFKEVVQTENRPENMNATLAHYYKKVWPFYMTRGVSFDLRIKHTKISCRFFVNPEAKAKILVVNGYNESYLKYAEVIYDLYHQGYSVYTYDHRGQGFSQKFPHQYNRGYMNKFDDLVFDLKFIFNFVDNHDQKQPVYVLAHSMGAAVTSLALFHYNMTPGKVVFSAPMFGINLGVFNFLELGVYFLARFLSKIGFSKNYAFGQGDCFPLCTFKKNEVTHSMARYHIWQTHVRETPDVQLGGPTFQWVCESIEASREARHLGNDNKIPILLLQAEKDSVVNNASQDIFVKNCANCEKKVLHNAKHEILLEVDCIRSEVLNYVIQFFCEEKN